jgi:amino acid adenylation domain-containing protein
MDAAKSATASSDPNTARLAALSPDRRALLEQRLRGARDPSLMVATIPRRRSGERLALSFAQQRLWFLEQLAPGNPFYNIPLNMRLTTRVNVDALTRAINEIACRHDILRTTFRSEDGEPVQVIAERLHVPLPLIDLRGMPVEAREDEARRLATLEAQQPFTLERGPLIRTTLVQLADADFLFLLSMHHIVSDGWSMGVFSRELSALYPAFALGWPSPLPELSIQYSDFAMWQRSWLRGAVLERQLVYWKTTLADLPTLELPTDRPRPPMQSFRGAYHRYALDAGLSERVRALARSHDVTLFMTLFAAFAGLLHRYTGQADLVIGSPIANRTRRELEPLIGFFVNSLVLRTDLNGDPTFAELLQRVRETALGAYAHQDLPFELLVEALHPVRDPSRNPLFQVTFQLFTPHTERTASSGGGGEPVAIQRGTAIFDIAFTLMDAGGPLTGGFEYDTDLFDADTIERMGVHLRVLLEAAVAAPQRRISELPLLTLGERHRLTIEWNATHAAYPALLLDQLIARTADRVPGATAVVAHDGNLSYRDLETRATQLARFLQQLGVGRNELVAVCLERSLDMVVALLAVLKAGAAYVPLDPAYPPQRLAFMLRDSAARVLLTRPAHAAALDAGDATVVDLADAWDAIGTSPPAQRLVDGRTPEDLAYVIYTSGSTGQPKGVAISHRAICNHMHWLQQRFPLDEEDRVLQRTPFSFDASVWEFHAPLAAGALLIMADPAVQKDPAQILQCVREHCITVLQLVPSLLEMLLDQPDFAQARCLRRVFCGGEALAAALVQRFHARCGAELVNLYGPTEAAIDTAYWVSPGTGSVPSVVPIGRPIANAEVYILDAHAQPVPVGVPGELHIGGAGLARGYLGRPALTLERFIAHPFRDDPAARVYKTGDLARYRADGNIEFLGRLDHQVKLRGYRIELAEIEAALGEHAGVRDAAVLCREDQRGDRRLVAYVVCATGGDVAAATSDADAAGITRWRTIFDETHREHVAADPAFDIVGWNSSYTGLPIPEEEMREAVEQTVSRLVARRPHRVLEIGCGTGLILLRLAPECEVYWGTDFSQATLDGLAPQVARAGLAHVRLVQQRADETAAMGSEQFDLVVLNSVVQYFPTAEYLARVLRQLLPYVTPGGALFVGDVRSLPLLPALHASVELAQAPADLAAATVQQRVRWRAAQEQELALAPEFFDSLRAELPGIGRVDVELKRGRTHNELTRFRYDVILHVGAPPLQDAVIALSQWPAEGHVPEAMRARLEASSTNAIGFADVPNVRVAEAVRAAALLERGGASASAGGILARAADAAADAIDPELFHAVATAAGGAAHVRWAASGRSDAIDVVLTLDPTAPPPFPPTPAPRGGSAAFANDPRQGAFMRELVPDLRRHLQRRLPDYMVPAAYVLLDELPLAPNGKLDRAALPLPDPGRLRNNALVAPRSATEERLARLWSEVLGVPHIGVHDNFFTELGGHSLVGTQLMSRIRMAFAIDLPLYRLFEAPTVAQLGVHVDAAVAGRQEPRAVGLDAERVEPELAPVRPDELTGADFELLMRARLAREGDRA